MTQRPCETASHRVRGFSMIEASLVLVIVALIVGAIVVPLASRFETRRIEDTERLLDLAQNKLLAFAVKYGYLPCPALDGTNGAEPAAANHTTGTCPQYFGYLPAATLGWTPVDSEGYALDAWGTPLNRIRYAVANDAVGGIANAFTRLNGIANAGTTSVAAASLLRVCGSGSGVTAGVDCGTAPTLAANAAAVVWSVGANARSGGTNVHESQNPNPNGGSADRIFVSRTRSEGSSEPEFDDVMRWIPAPLLAARLAAAGMMTPAASGSSGTGGGGGAYGTAYTND